MNEEVEGFLAKAEKNKHNEEDEADCVNPHVDDNEVEGDTAIVAIGLEVQNLLMEIVEVMDEVDVEVNLKAEVEDEIDEVKKTIGAT